MTLDPKLLEILACPEDKGPLLYFDDENFLYNDRLHRRYLIKEIFQSCLLMNQRVSLKKNM